MSASEPFVYVIDDDASIRISLSRLLKLEGFQIILFSSAEEFLVTSKFKRPACIISDIRMPGLSGLELQEICVNRGISIPIIFITGHGEVPISVQAMKKGAVDFLQKPYSRESLLDSLSQAIEKDRMNFTQENSMHRVQSRFDTLSEREKEVLQGVVEGLLNKQIAYKLGITEKTVKVHRANVMMKMKADSVPQLVKLAETVGIS